LEPEVVFTEVNALCFVPLAYLQFISVCPYEFFGGLVNRDYVGIVNYVICEMSNMFTKSILSGTIAAMFCIASFANAATISHTVDLHSTSPYGMMSGSSASGFSMNGITHSVGGVTLVYNLDMQVDWLDSSGASATGFTGNVTYLPGSATVAVPMGFETNNIAGVDEEHRDIDGFYFTPSGGTMAAYYEQVTFTVSGLQVMGGTASFTGFSGYLTGNNPAAGSASGPAAGVAQVGIGTPSLSLNPIIGNDVTGNMDNSDFRMRNIVLDFDVTAVPEPNSAMLLGLVGVLMAGRRWKQCLTA